MRPSKGRIWGRRLIAVAGVAVVIAAGFLFWLRNSSLFEVEEVVVVGATTSKEQIKTALAEAAKDMTTLHVREDDLAHAVSGFPTVASLKVDAMPLHKLEIEITERTPVATVGVGDESVPVSGDGHLLRGLELDRELPSIEPASPPGSQTLAEDDIEQAELLGAAPPELLEQVDGTRLDPEAGGVVADLDNGIELRLGDSSDATAKWAAAAAVFVDPGLGTPAYVDVSVPDKPVSGG